MQTPRVITEAARNQFESTYKMLVTVVDVCPDDMWYEYFSGVPFWYQVYHSAYFVDYWLRDAFDGSEFRSMIFDSLIPPEFEHPVGRKLSISRKDMKEYLEKVQHKVTRFFTRLDDAQLGETVDEGQKQTTYADVILAQNRHIMYNIGYLNALLRSRGLEESDWYAYNEEEE